MLRDALADLQSRQFSLNKEGKRVNHSETPVCPEWYQPLLIAVTETLPCGENLEDDSAFIMLESRLQPRMGAEYGDFVEAVDPVNWAEIEREVKILLTRSLDLRLVMILIRCRFRHIGIPALDEGLRALIWLLLQWPTQLYPQLYEEGIFDPVIRANVLAELDAAEGILGDLRRQSLPKVASLQLTVRDIERARLTPHAEPVLDESTLALAHQCWLEQQSEAITALCQAEQHLHQFHALLSETLTDETPDFNDLFTLLRLFQRAGSPAATLQHRVQQPAIANLLQAPVNEICLPDAEPSPVVAATVPALSAAAVTLCSIQDRSDALMRLREVQQWFVHYEPSSPVGDLLALTEQMVGKRFAELMQSLPQDLIARLSNGQET